MSFKTTWISIRIWSKNDYINWWSINNKRFQIKS